MPSQSTTVMEYGAVSPPASSHPLQRSPLHMEMEPKVFSTEVENSYELK